MITEQQEQAAAQSAQNRNRQDRKIPFLIHIEDGRLMPNVQSIRELPEYRPYQGPDPLTATTEERLAWLRSSGPYRRVKIVDSSDAEPFDLATAPKEDLLDFARGELSMTDVNESTDIRTLRKQVKARWEALNGPLA